MNTDDTPRRGRPRPEDTIERDRQVLDLLIEEGPLPRNQIADRLGTTHTLAYLALTRLRNRGLVKRCLEQDGSSIWSTGVGSPCP
jgi:predicted ArsR family transcriptional regulator